MRFFERRIINDLSFRIVADERASVDGGSFFISCFNSSIVHSIFSVSSNANAHKDTEH